jgi:hypothetical protein
LVLCNALINHFGVAKKKLKWRRNVVFDPVLSAVKLELVLDFELLVADVALVWQHLVHEPLVRAQCLSLRKGVAANAARVRPQTLVQQYVSAQYVARSVGVAAVVALVRPRFDAVARRVRLQARAVRKTLAAHLAHKSLLAGVRHQMFTQTRLAVCAPAANVTLLSSRLRRVDLQVLPKTHKTFPVT